MVKNLSLHPHEELTVAARAKMSFLPPNSEIPEDLMQYVDVVPGRDFGALGERVSRRVGEMLFSFAPDPDDYSDPALISRRAILELIPDGMEIPEAFLGYVDVTTRRPDLDEQIETRKALILSSLLHQ
ncbi:hypothetical protein KA071_00155 [Candidatus Gracilibacteria bacterium]|nr:hypothetical protein [Candidatus Gracilibacteria bacterium]